MSINTDGEISKQFHEDARKVYVAQKAGLLCSACKFKEGGWLQRQAAGAHNCGPQRDDECHFHRIGTIESCTSGCTQPCSHDAYGTSGHGNLNPYL